MTSISYFSIIIFTFVCHLIGITLFIILQYLISSSDFINLCVEDLGFSSSEEESLLISLKLLLSSRIDTLSFKLAFLFSSLLFSVFNCWISFLI
jgi:hypothetical protein